MKTFFSLAVQVGVDLVGAQVDGLAGLQADQVEEEQRQHAHVAGEVLVDLGEHLEQIVGLQFCEKRRFKKVYKEMIT